MASDDIERTHQLARNLVDMLASYEEELIMLETDAPAISQLRRAVGAAIAEACYLISDGAAGSGLSGPAAETRTWR